MLEAVSLELSLSTTAVNFTGVVEVESPGNGDLDVVTPLHLLLRVDLLSPYFLAT
jgi:hypothetical protein